MIIIGETLNASISRIEKSIENRDVKTIQGIALQQTGAGADYLDLCAAGTMREAENLAWLVETVQAVTRLPLCIDSPNPSVLLETAPLCERPGLFNSISGEESEENALLYHTLAENPGWGGIFLLNTGHGVPQTVEERLDILEIILKKAKFYGIRQEQIYIDPLVEAAAFSEPCENTEKTRAELFLQVVGEIRKRYSKIHIAGAISNISFGLPAREYMEGSFAVLALAAGMDVMILDPKKGQVRGNLAGALSLLGIHEDVMCMNYVKDYRRKLFP